MSDDLALTAARFGAALRAEGCQPIPAVVSGFARAVTVARPATGARLYLCALATLVVQPGAHRGAGAGLRRDVRRSWPARSAGPQAGDAPASPGAVRAAGRPALAQAALGRPHARRPGARLSRADGRRMAAGRS